MPDFLLLLADLGSISLDDLELLKRVEFQAVWDRFSSRFALLTLFFISCVLINGDGY